MRLREYNALKATLDYLALLNPEGVLMVGEDRCFQRSFCYPISLAKAKSKLLGCTHLEIRAVGHYIDVESKVVAWLQRNIRLPPGRCWWNMVSPSNWLKYNIAADLYILHLSVAHRHYYICMRQEHVLYYRQQSFSPTATRKAEII